MATDSPSNISSLNFLTTGSEYMAAHSDLRDEEDHPDFKLVGRKKEMKLISTALLKKGPDNHVILTGRSGVGLTSIVMGIEASKKDPSTPFPIVEKNVFHLDANLLFSSRDVNEIATGFQKAMDKLTQLTAKTKNSEGKDVEGKDVVLVIDDTKGFLTNIVDAKTTSMINILMNIASTNNHFQFVLVAGNQDVPAVYNIHTGIEKLFTLVNVEEPSKDDLRAITKTIAEDIARKYGTAVSDKAIDTALELTTKFPLPRLPAQPRLNRIILENAMAAHILKAQEKPPELAPLEETLTIVKAALESGKPAKGDLADRTPEQLEGIRSETQDHIDDIEEKWKEKQKEIRNIYADMVLAQAGVQEQNTLIQNLNDKNDYKNVAMKKLKDATAELEAAEKPENYNQETVDQINEKIKAIKKDFKDRFLDKLELSDDVSQIQEDFNAHRNQKAQYYASEIEKAAKDRTTAEKALQTDRAEYEELMKDACTDAELTDDDVLGEFSRLSGTEVGKLNQDNRQKLINLEETLGKEIFGQPEAIKEVADAAKAAIAGYKEPEEAVGNFMFAGLTGTGKTELARVLAGALFDDPKALNIWPMENFQQSNSSTQLFGAPPGYVGYEEGGQLIEAMIRTPACVNVYDEIEKAHPKMFDNFLNITGEHAIVLDTKTGKEVSFANAVNIFTTNLGSKHLLDTTISPKEQRRRVKNELRENFRPEFLARVTIVYFNQLEPEQVAMIAKKNLRKLDELAVENGLTLTMPEAAVKAMCADVYTPWTGGRGVRDFIKQKIRPYLTNLTLEHPGEHGDVQVTYIPGKVSDEEKAQIREEVENDEEFDIRKEIENDKKLMSKLMRQLGGEILDSSGAISSKMQEAVDAKVKEKLEDKVAEKIKEQEIENSAVDAKFIAKDPAEPAAQATARVAANVNDRPAAAAKAPALSNG